MSTSPVRVVLVDDQALFLEALETLLAAQASVRVVGRARTGAEAIEVVDATVPDVVLMDLRMPVLDGVAATRRIRADHPEVQVIALTTFDDDDDVFPVLRAGAIGYLLKDVTSEKLVDAVHSAAAGESPLQPSVAARLVARVAAGDPRPTAPAAQPLLDRLTDRELEVLGLLAGGRSNREIAAALFLAEGTVKNHVSVVFAKLGVRDRTQAVLRAKALGLA